MNLSMTVFFENKFEYINNINNVHAVVDCALSDFALRLPDCDLLRTPYLIEILYEDRDNKIKLKTIIIKHDDNVSL